MADRASYLPGNFGFKDFHQFIGFDREWPEELFRSIITVFSTIEKDDENGKYRRTTLELKDKKNLEMWGRIMHEATVTSGKLREDTFRKGETNFEDVDDIRAFISKQEESYWLTAFERGRDGSLPTTKQCNGILWAWYAYVADLERISVSDDGIGYHKSVPVVSANDIRKKVAESMVHWADTT
ncbi:hypothetical protein HYFRA_00002251 [Hymenoscyphus fraxineus]|uniref:Uncharacterized protein n=1 Tax=Hymenoscyphus fraxineus TaxID=746836 RepID=A0A9N9KP97_9HELO|nr:hypothetical protein HYFRA_00002251 [Hymenoscyphus fraxineus]